MCYKSQFFRSVCPRSSELVHTVGSYYIKWVAILLGYIVLVYSENRNCGPRLLGQTVYVFQITVFKKY